MTAQQINRYVTRLVIICLTLTVVLSILARVWAAPTSIPITTANSQPRPIEDATALAITRAYSSAWTDLAHALSTNDASALNQSFVGYAHQRYAAQIADQLKNGMSVRLVPHTHAADAVFYSIDGSALEIHDNVQMEKQVLDGSKVVASETRTIPYVAILTVVEDRWKLRVLQESLP